MATIGQQLLQPEMGWKRYNDDHANFSYDGASWIVYTPGINHYQGDYHYSKAVGDRVQFNFTGTKLRILTTRDSISKVVGGSWDVYVDGIKIGSYSNFIGILAQCILYFEVENLENKEHFVELVITDTTGVVRGANFDMIDIDETGELLPYKINFPKYLIKSNEDILTLDINDNLEVIKHTPPVKLDFETHGFEILNPLIEEKISKTKPMNLLKEYKNINGITVGKSYESELTNSILEKIKSIQIV